MLQPTKFFYKRLNSTNLYASQMLLKQSVREPFWLRTDDQFAGRGQGNHTWISEPGQNLTGTLVIFPHRFEASHQFDLSKTFALAVAGFLDLFIDKVRIKWPNDLYAEDKKIGGILIETAVLSRYLDYAILGAGININQEKFPGNLPNPISISILTGLKYDLHDMENLFLESFLKKYYLIESGSFEEINNQYINKLYRYGEFVDFKDADQIFTAKITGVTEYGHLILQTASGTIKTYAYPEVEYIL